MTEGRVEPPPWREVFQGTRGRLITGLLLLESLVAVYALLITAIMPAVRDDLGGTNLYGFASAVWGLATILSIPIAGHAADRFGPRKPLMIVIVVMITGMAVSGFAPTIEVFIIGLFLQGFAGGALYAVSLGTVAKTFPEHIRARVMALLATMWILPGLLGPALGATVAEHLGWRWAFAISPPLMFAAVLMVLPALGRVPADEEAEKLPVLWSALTTLGLGLFLGGTASVTPVGLAVAVIGLVMGALALVQIVPRGTLTAKRGMPAAAASMFLLSAAFFTVDWFVPLMLTELHGFSYQAAGLVITCATVTWSLGSWWQSRNAGRRRLGTLVTIGAVLVLIGMLLVTTGLSQAFPLCLVYLGWVFAGGGMGIAFPTIPLAVMSVAEVGKEAGQLSSTLLMDTLGMTIGTGLGGTSIAFATANGEAGLRTGIGGAYALGFVALLLLLIVARRIPEPASALHGEAGV